MNKDRLEELLNNCVSYLVELKRHESAEEQEMFWKNIIGMTDEEMKKFDLAVDKVEKLRVYHITNKKSTYYNVSSTVEGKRLIEKLADADLADTSVIYNVFGLEVWNNDTQDWEERYDENGYNIDGEQW